jgi:hypothetical protein
MQVAAPPKAARSTARHGSRGMPVVWQRDESILLCRFAFKTRLFARHEETFPLGVPSECRKQHSRKHFGHLFRQSGALTQSHHGGTKGFSVSS